MAARVYTVDFGGTDIQILSAEDLVVCKALFDRAKDWVDIEGVCAVRGQDLDEAYMVRWLDYFLEKNDPITVRLASVVEAKGARRGRP